MSALLRGAMKTGYDEIAMKAGRIPMKQLSLALILLLAAAAAARDAALPERIGARRDRAGNILLGSALIRKSDRTISFPGRINIREGVIEVLVSTSRGRMHESLIVTDLDPFQLQMALILAGYGNGDRKTGASFHIEVVWGKSVRTPVDEWLYDNTAILVTSDHGDWGIYERKIFFRRFELQKRTMPRLPGRKSHQHQQHGQKYDSERRHG